MPIYEYRCEACNEQTDVFHRTRKEPTPVCPSCGEDALKRLVSRTHFQLKGGGWYVTDYAKASEKKSSEKKSSESSSSASAESTSETASGSSESDSGDSSASSTESSGETSSPTGSGNSGESTAAA